MSLFYRPATKEKARFTNIANCEATVIVAQFHERLALFYWNFKIANWRRGF
jgi:hypothetical protein